VTTFPMGSARRRTVEVRLRQPVVGSRHAGYLSDTDG